MVSRSYRLIAIHAVELYLNAFLLASGHSSASLRSLHHNLAARAKLAISLGLSLRKRTSTHLENLSDTREYLTSRYDPAAATVSELNRVAASLTEIADKVTDFINRSEV